MTRLQTGVLVATLSALGVLTSGRQVHAALGDFTFTTTAVNPPSNVATLIPGAEPATLTFTPLTGSGNAASSIGTVVTLENVAFAPGTGTGSSTPSFSQAFSFTTQFVDTTTGENINDPITFSGSVTGAAQGGTGGGINPGPVAFTAPATPVTFTVGSGTPNATTYTINFSASSSNGPSLNQPGELRAAVVATAVPEPTSVVLMGIGGVSMLGLYWRCRLRPAA